MTNNNGPLSGIKVVTCSTAQAGTVPYMLMADLGAQVIKMACLDNDILKGGEYLSNCYVKATEGENGCSNDENQWNKLWELSSKQIEENEYEKFISSADDEDDDSTKKAQ